MDGARHREAGTGPAAEHDRRPAVRAARDAPSPQRAGLRPDHAHLLALQEHAGNQAVGALLRAADSTVDGPAADGPAAPAVPSGSTVGGPSGAGDPLPEVHRTAFERAIGQPLDHVRIHQGPAPDEAARALGAEAFTIGSDIYFASGSYAPGTPDGDRRLGHELTHVAQHDAGLVPRADPTSAAGLVSSPTDALERQAYGLEGAVAEAADAARRPGTGPPLIDAEAIPDAPAPAARLGRGAPAPVLRSTGAAPQAAEPAAARRATEPDSARQATEPADPGGGPADDQLLPVPAPAPAVAAPTGQAAPAPPAPPGPPAPDPPSPPVPTGGSPVDGPAPAGLPSTDGPAANGPATDGPAPIGPAASSPAPIALPSTDGPGPLREIAAQAQASTERVAAEVARLIGEARAAAAGARVELTSAYGEQVQALDGRTAAALAAVAAARQEQQAAVATAGDTQRQRLAEAHRAAVADAVAHVAALRQETIAAGEAQATRARAESQARAAAITGQAEAVPVTGEAPSAQAQRESARRIARRAADQCRSTGAQVADRVRREAAHHAATTYDGMLRDHLAKLDEARAAAEPMIGELTRQASVAIDRKAADAGAAIRALDGRAAASLDRERASALAAVDAWEAQTTTALEQAGARADHALAAELAPAAEVFAGTAGADAQPGTPQARADVAAARDLVLAGVARAGDDAAAGLGGLYAELLGGLTGSVADGGSAAAVAGRQLQQALGAGADGAVADMGEAAGAFQRRLAAGVTEAVGRLAGAGQEFRGGTAEVHQGALVALTRAVDDGLAGQDDLLARAGAELAGVTGRVAAAYTGLKTQARQRSEAEQPVPATRIHRGIWSSITGWISDLHASAKRWFADTFGQVLGGLLLGILEGLVIVAVGLLLATVVGAIVAAVVASAKVAAIITIGVLLVAGIGLSIYNRFQEFYHDNPGQAAGLLRGLALVGLGVADLTGIPYIVEGLVGRRAFGATMSTFDSMERLGMGVVFLGAVLVSAKNLLRARPRTTEPPPTRTVPEPGERVGQPAGERVGQPAGERARRGCFVPGTPVLTPDGPRAIEALRPGDAVLAYDVRREQVVPRTVRAALARTVAEVLDIAVAGQTITCSPEHPFWTPDTRGWLPAGDLGPGTVLLSPDGGKLTVDGVRRRPATGWRVHNITVAGPHTYLVSVAGIVVHNKASEADPPELLAAREAADTRLQQLRQRVAQARERAQQLPEGERRAAQGKLAEIAEQLETIQDNVAGADSPETVSSFDDWTADLDGQLREVEGGLPERPAPAPEEEPAGEADEGPVEGPEEEPAADRPEPWEDMNPTDRKDWPPEWNAGPHKEAVPGQSGKEGATDIPDWAAGARPRVGESGNAFAQRLLGYRYPGRPPGTFARGPGSDWNRLRKFADRGYRDPVPAR